MVLLEKVNVGFGLSRYKLFDVYDDENNQPEVFGTEISIAGVVEKKTIQRFMHKVPPQHRKVVSKLNEVSVSSILIPKTLYIQPLSDSGIEAYGVTWGLVPKIGAHIGPFGLFLGGGIIATYMYFRDETQEDPVHFIRPGLRGVAGFTVPLFTRNLILEVGGKGDIYAPQKFYADQEDKSLWNIRGVYMQLHFRIPLEVEAAI